MLPEIKLRFFFPGFGSVELEGECVGKEHNYHEVSIKFTPSSPAKDRKGVVIKLCRDGNCFIQELKPLPKEEEMDVIGCA